MRTEQLAVEKFRSPHILGRNPRAFCGTLAHANPPSLSTVSLGRHDMIVPAEINVRRGSISSQRTSRSPPWSWLAARRPRFVRYL